uniref:Uncharacterized protein n=1 Tax=Anguilla anguilla TaxID=7936 RepID=A0A0E9UER4_ANGAN
MEEGLCIAQAQKRR